MCRTCAFKALRRNEACPYCRAPTARPQQLADLAVDQELEQVLETAEPKAYELRRNQADEEERTIAEALAAATRAVPLFYMGDIAGFEMDTATALHLFEPRYRCDGRPLISAEQVAFHLCA